MKIKILLLFFLSHLACLSQNEPSIAKKWMDVMLKMVQQDGQGPTIQARNFFHTTAAMYDAWAAYDENQETYFLNKDYHGHFLKFNPKKLNTTNIDSLRNIAISHAAFNVLQEKYSQYGSKGRTVDIAVDLMESLGYYKKRNDTNYEDGSPESLGNYIAKHIEILGKVDGSREDDKHESEEYILVNSNLRPELPGVGDLNDPNQWQPIQIENYIATKGNDKTLKEWNYLLVQGNTQFLTSFWGEVFPFALPKNSSKPIFDPGTPPLLTAQDSISSQNYRWGFQLVQDWSGYLSSKKSKLWNLTPKGITSMEQHLPKNMSEYKTYYEKVKENKFINLKTNPVTKKPYATNTGKQGDYCRVTAEFWVDGPNTNSPPGHWLQFLNEVSYHPNFKRKWEGKGKSLSQLEWDIKSNFALCGTFHDAAIACWAIKLKYNYVRPITAIRYLGSLGQSSNSKLPNYNPNGLQLKKGSVALVGKNDPLVGANKEHLNKVKIYSWKGPDAVNDPFTDTAGVGWILAENWWPYQRYTFATPPFAGYTSGHSTFSIAGAELLTHITGSPYFPEGLKTFTACQNEYLGFEDGPSETIELQWATYYDAAIETCLSRVWGGIHPPADDIEGRRMGQKIAKNTINFTQKFFKK